MSENCETLTAASEDVLNILKDSDNLHFYPHKMFKPRDFLTAFTSQIARDVTNTDKQEKWLDKGVECEFLKLGSSNWQKGKLKIKVIIEFHPDESE